MFKFLRKKTGKDSFIPFAKGKLLSLDKVPDPVFSKKMMGDGFAIDISEGRIYSPVEGEVTLVFPTGHSYGITSDHAVEVLIHIGVRTIELDGQGFKPKVKQGDRVKKGQIIAEVDLDFLREQGKSTISSMIFTSGHEVQVLKENQNVDLHTKNIIHLEERENHDIF